MELTGEAAVATVWAAMLGLLGLIWSLQRRSLAAREGEPPHISEHIKVDDGGLRAAVFGFSDGVVSNVSLILGVYVNLCHLALGSGAAGAAGAAAAVGSLEESRRSVVVSGLAGLLAGACSMACGEWISMQAQKEGLECELAVEKRHLEQYQKEERKLLRKALMRHGVTAKTADAAIRDLNRDPDKLLPFHAQMVLGINSEDTGSPVKSALFSFACFAFGAITPVVPWILIRGDHNLAFKWTVILVCTAVFAAGALLSKFSPWGIFWNSARQLLVVAASILLSMATSYCIIGSVVNI